jgi:hypothetical protein
MAVRRECTKIGHAVPWTVDASLITLSGPRASPLVVSARLFGCHSEHGRHARPSTAPSRSASRRSAGYVTGHRPSRSIGNHHQSLFPSRRDKSAHARRAVNRTRA